MRENPAPGRPSRGRSVVFRAVQVARPFLPRFAVKHRRLGYHNDVPLAPMCSIPSSIATGARSTGRSMTKFNVSEHLCNFYPHVILSLDGNKILGKT
jgi:hypothetical protein